MSKFLKNNRQDLKSKIFTKLNLSTNEESDAFVDRDSLRQENSQEHLDKLMKETEKKKMNIRKLITTNNPHSEFSDEMAQLKWRIDALRNFNRNQKEKLLMPHRSTSLTGKQEENVQRQLTFDELYELQKKKFALLRERRKTKIGDPKYVDMIGNMQLRKEKRKTMSKVKVEDQMRILNQKIQQKIE